jgi:hypothetical protein
MSEYGGFEQPVPPEDPNAVVNRLPSSSVMPNPAQYFRIDLDQAPQTIAAFRKAAEELRDIVFFEADRLRDFPAPGQDGVSIHAAREISQWSGSAEPGSLSSALESGAIQLEKAADALECSLATHQHNDEASADRLKRLKS